MCGKAEIKAAIDGERTVLGIELGSTKIKAVLITENYELVASGSYTWESLYENGVWTYPLEEVWKGLRAAYAGLAEDVRSQYGTELRKVRSMGVSAMMHGYLAFDGEGRLLAPFRTWQNTNTGPAAAELSRLFNFNIPQRWSIAHLYQAILNRETHVGKICFLTTLAGYVHWALTGRKVLGIGDASGMFPIDSETLNYDQSMLKQFGELTVSCKYSWKLPEILPEVLTAGEAAGTLTESGARRLDPSGVLQSGIMFCPPEGDAGTGMTATNSVGAGTGNVSAGTSVFAMVVLEKRLKNAYRQIDMVATPAGRPVAMVHCNNCTGDLNAWVQLFLEYSERLQVSADPGEVYQAFYREAAKGEPDCGGVVVCNYLAGEPVANLEEGYPMVLRVKKQPFTLPNFCRASLYSAIATLKMGMDILAEEEVGVNRLMGHGGLFRNGDIGAEILAAAVDTAISTMGPAVMGGPYGMALLAAYARDRKKGEGLEEFLSEQVFARSQVTETKPDAVNVAGFRNYMKYFKVMLKAEKTAVDNLKQEGQTKYAEGL